MKIINCRGVDRRVLEDAVAAIRDGKIIIYPTDTLYALGCDALSNRAIESLCRIKGINPEKSTLSIVCSDISQASEYARIDNRAFRLLKEHLPGPFTFILPASTTLPKVFKGRRTVGLRIPDSDFARALAENLGHPIMTTSVALDAHEDMCDPLLIAEKYSGYKDIDLIVDNGESDSRPSTIIDLTDSSDPQLIRQGKGLMND